MDLIPRLVLAAVVVAFGVVTPRMPRLDAALPQPGPTERINLAERLAAGKLRAVNREISKAADRADAVHLSGREGTGVAWIEGTDFGQGTIDVEVRGRDVLQQSFVGVAFHRRDDTTHEVVYLRPFNFRAVDPVRHQHAVQYAVFPDLDWPRLRKEFPEEFENPVDGSIDPTAWVPLRIVVGAKTIQIYVGAMKTPTLEVRKLGTLDRGMVGLFVGNTSDGDFANLRIAASK